MPPLLHTFAAEIRAGPASSTSGSTTQTLEGSRAALGGEGPDGVLGPMVKVGSVGSENVVVAAVAAAATVASRAARRRPCILDNASAIGSNPLRGGFYHSIN